VLIAPKDSSVNVNIQPGFDLAALDVAADLRVKIVGMFPENSHPPVALTKQSTNADAQAFLNYLRSARRPFERQGFTVPVQGQQS
jgi:ABC-type molybdate transport system substrate-binding protein